MLVSQRLFPDRQSALVEWLGLRIAASGFIKPSQVVENGDPITAFGDAAGPIDLTRGMAARGQPEVGADTPRAPEAGWLVDCGTEGQGIDRPNPRHRHQTTAFRVVPGQGQESAGETGDFSAYNLAHAKEGTYRLLQQAMLTNEFLGPATEDLAPPALPMTRPRS